MLGLGETDNIPGLALPKSPRVSGFDAANYQETFGHAPVYHGGKQDEGSLVQRLRQIQLQFQEPLNTNDKNSLIQQMRLLYETEPYKKLNMWPVARDWLRAQPNLDSLIIVPN